MRAFRDYGLKFQFPSFNSENRTMACMQTKRRMLGLCKKVMHSKDFLHILFIYISQLTVDLTGSSSQVSYPPPPPLKKAPLEWHLDTAR